MHEKFSFVVAELQSMYKELLKSDKFPFRHMFHDSQSAY